MPPAIDLTGLKFNHWAVLYRFHKTKWQCRCICGTEKPVESYSLKSGSSPSCGCKSREERRRTAKRLNHLHPVLYSRWANMIQRCTNPKMNAYADYGGRGISVCKQWIESFETFLNDMGDPPDSEATLDRYPDNNGNYEPGNVRWATRIEQAENKRSVSLITYGGTTKSIAGWARFFSIHYQTLYHRIVNMSLPLSEAIKRQR